MLLRTPAPNKSTRTGTLSQPDRGVNQAPQNDRAHIDGSPAERRRYNEAGKTVAPGHRPTGVSPSSA